MFGSLLCQAQCVKMFKKHEKMELHKDNAATILYDSRNENVTSAGN